MPPIGDTSARLAVCIICALVVQTLPQAARILPLVPLCYGEMPIFYTLKP